jgi:hypothetical protein
VSESLRSGPWTIFRGTLAACGGTWNLEDAYRLRDSIIEGRRRFTWNGPGIAPHITLSVRFQVAAGRGEVMLPGILYSGNPSGARSGKVPVYTQAAGDEAFFEEHRYPEPFAFKELGSFGAALHSVPSPVPYGNLADQWWSLGMHELPGAITELELLSGPCASNGQHSVVRAVQGGSLPYADAYLNIPPGGQIEKTFFLDAYPVQTEGSGFERSVWKSIEFFEPYSLAGMPTFAEIVEAKYRYAITRWLDQAPVAGFRKYSNRNDIVMGWTGEAEGPGFALQVLGSHLADPSQAHDMAIRSLDFLATTKSDSSGFRYWWDPRTQQWTRQDLLNQAQAMLNFARAIEVGRQHKEATGKWEDFLKAAAETHAKRILNASWRPEPTTEAFFIAPLLKSAVLFHDPQMREAALKAADYFASRHLSMEVPYWGGTSDAQCEDKEGAYGAFQGFLYAYEATHDPKYLKWAQHAADVVLSYLVVWDIDLPAGPLRDANFRTHGWTMVSPQSQHLDVFGALIAPDLYRLGLIERDDRLKQIAVVMYRSAGQMIDVYGSQGEQLYETNYSQHGEHKDISGMRGAYFADWTVFWTTAHFLSGAAEFQEMGVPIFTDEAGR